MISITRFGACRDIRMQATPGRRQCSPSIGAAFQAALRPASPSFTAHAAIDAVRRALPRDGVLSFDVGAHTHRSPASGLRTRPRVSHHQRLVVDGLRLAGSDRGQARAARPAGRVPPRRRLFPDDLRRGRGRQAPRAQRFPSSCSTTAGSRSSRSSRSSASSRSTAPSCSAEDYREPPAHYFGVPAIGVSSADALEAAVHKALRRQWADRDRGRRRFRALHGHGLRLSELGKQELRRGDAWSPCANSDGCGIQGEACLAPTNNQLCSGRRS